MAVQKWIYEKATGKFLSGGFSEPATVDPATQGIAEIGEAVQIDPVKDRYDPASQTHRRHATPEELTSAETARFDQVALAKILEDPIGTAKAIALYEIFLGRLSTKAERYAVFNTIKQRYAALLKTDPSDPLGPPL